MGVPIDLTGQVFNRLTALSIDLSRSGKIYWVCQCSCGKVSTVAASKLKSGHTKSCGCLAAAATPISTDLTGRKFGRWAVVSRSEKGMPKYVYWNCRCDCGVEKAVEFSNLTLGKTQSCGCLSRERATSHGKAKSKTYCIWVAMLQRTTNPNCMSSKNYLDRGITVCDRWLQFENFLADMGEKPPSLTLERLDNEQGYHPGNCAWASRGDQARNKRGNRLLTAFGETKVITDWAAQFRISPGTIGRRLFKYKWDTEKALTHPPANLGRRASKAFQDKLMS
jgi:hypothetical protein